MAVLANIGFISLLLNGLWWFPLVNLPLGIGIIFINYWAYDFTRDLIVNGVFFESNFKLSKENKDSSEQFAHDKLFPNLKKTRVIRKCKNIDCKKFVRLPVNGEGLVKCPHCKILFIQKLKYSYYHLKPGWIYHGNI